ncbi:neutral zinc metallopeptidase [Streptomyces sp. NPDC048603]|uniref:KPN_02809 family neutral zinc metallopeptidase n=1 Tax=Streptomyces sp. NPDC048603 TaxID=3365577 RepID=UPI0037213530
MQFDEDANVDTSDVQDVRGHRIPGGKATIGGGLVGLIALVMALLFGVGPDQLGLSSGETEPSGTASSASEVQRACGTGAAANAREDCRLAFVARSTQDFWNQEFGRRGGQYRPATTVVFGGRVNTGCGTASSAVGPFYCPVDRKVYVDLAFFRELQTRFGASGGPFAQAYVVAHEYGHHVQNLLGTLQRAQDGRTGAASNAVKVELQADCYAGVWTRNATTTPDRSTGRPLVSRLSEQDIRDGLDAAAAVGDDRIQEKLQGRVTPENWTHGSAAQRQQWFYQGYRTGDMAQCNTFR